MSIELRLPKITATSEREQLLQLKSYLYQLTEQLQIALNIANEPNGSAAQQVVIQATNTPTVAPPPVDAAVTFAALKPFIIKSADIVEAYYEEINKKLEGLYVAQSDFGTFTEKTEQKIKETSEYTEREFSNVQTIITETRLDFSTSLGATKTEFNKSLGNARDELSGAIDSAVDNFNENIEGAKGELSGAIDDAKSDLEGKISDAKDYAEAEIAGAKDNIDGLGKDVSRIDGEVSAIPGQVDEKVGAAKSELEDKQAKTKEELGKVKEDVKGLNTYVVETQAYIKTGKVDEEIRDGIPIPIYGIQIGQTDSINNNKYKRFARFTADRLSFFDENDYEVAYISKSKLYINNAEIKESCKNGGFKDEVNQNTGDVVTKWEGWG